MTTEVPVRAGLSNAEAAHLREYGYVVPDFRLRPDRVAGLQAALTEVIRINPDVRPESLRCAHIVKNNPDGIHGHEAFLELALDPQILDLVEAAIGGDIIFWGCHY